MYPCLLYVIVKNNFKLTKKKNIYILFLKFQNHPRDCIHVSMNLYLSLKINSSPAARPNIPIKVSNIMYIHLQYIVCMLSKIQLGFPYPLSQPQSSVCPIVQYPRYCVERAPAPRTRLWQTHPMLTRRTTQNKNHLPPIDCTSSIYGRMHVSMKLSPFQLNIRFHTLDGRQSAYEKRALTLRGTKLFTVARRLIYYQ